MLELYLAALSDICDNSCYCMNKMCFSFDLDKSSYHNAHVGLKCLCLEECIIILQLDLVSAFKMSTSLKRLCLFFSVNAIGCLVFTFLLFCVKNKTANMMILFFFLSDIIMEIIVVVVRFKKSIYCYFH